MKQLVAPIVAAALVASLAGQSTAVFPSDYQNVTEGPLNSANYPLAYGTSRVMCLYDHRDLDIPAGHQITAVGFRQDASLSTLETGRTLQLEIRMGYTTNTYANMVTNFDNNYAGASTTVFGPAVFTLPNLRDPASPLPNGQFFIPLTTPFTFNPGSNNLIVEYRVLGNSGGGTSWNYRLDRADYYSVPVQGPAGCPHSGNSTPVLAVNGVRPGLTYTNSLTHGPGNSLAVLMLAPGSQLVTPYPLQLALPGINPTCTGQLPLTTLNFITGLTSASGAVNFSFTIPNNQELYGKAYIASQVALFDFFAPGGVVVSNGAEVQLGRQPRASLVAAAGPPSTVTTGSLARNYCPVAFFTHQ